MKTRLLTFTVVLVLALAWNTSAVRASNGDNEGGEFHCDIGLTDYTAIYKLNDGPRFSASGDGILSDGLIGNPAITGGGANSFDLRIDGATESFHLDGANTVSQAGNSDMSCDLAGAAMFNLDSNYPSLTTVNTNWNVNYADVSDDTNNGRQTNDNSNEGGRFHFDLGISYVSGLQKVNSALESLVDMTGASYSSVAIPVGLQLDPYYLFDFGLGIGATVGPTEVISVSNQLAGFPVAGASDISAVIPVGADLRYEYINNSGFVPYVRAGFRYPITLGDNLSHGKPGFFGAGGVEFTGIHLGLEASYDSSTVDVNYGGNTQTVRPSDFMITLYFHF